MSDLTGPGTDAGRAVLLLKSGLAAWNIELSDQDGEAYETYARMLIEWNETRFNLTRLVSPDQIALNHFLDSLALTQVARVPANTSLLDIGTGAGFPGLAFKILRKDIRLTLVEATAKKLNFCREVAAVLGLQNIEFVHGRADEGNVLRKLHSSAGIVTARAVAPMKTLIEWTAPYVAPGGMIVAWKGPNAHAEVTDAHLSAERLGFSMDIVQQLLSVPDSTAILHSYVVCRPK
jgi:16S rRNA (guanine527-N7)-methyltransferase